MNLEERLVKMLLDRNEKVSTAESCTGGLVADCKCFRSI